MFTRAGINLSGARRLGIWADVGVSHGNRRGWAELTLFASGDLAWYSKQAEFLIWGLRATFWPRFYIVGHWGVPRSDIVTRRVH